MENLQHINNTLSSIIDKLKGITDEHHQIRYGLKHFSIFENTVKHNIENVNAVMEDALTELVRLREVTVVQLHKYNNN